MGSRSVLSVTLPVAGRPVEHTVEVRHTGDLQSGVVSARLYLDGRCQAESRLPASFPVADGHIEVRRGRAGLRRCRFVGADGTERHLVPHPASAEGRRMRLDRRHPALSRMVSAVSVVLLVVGVGINLVHLWGPITMIPAVVDAVGALPQVATPPVWLSMILGLGAALAVLERATSMRYHWLLDGGGT